MFMKTVNCKHIEYHQIYFRIRIHNKQKHVFLLQISLISCSAFVLGSLERQPPSYFHALDAAYEQEHQKEERKK